MEISGDYYEILQISRGANTDEIKKAYRKLALKWHPDKNLDCRELAEANFKKVSEAYEVLSDQGKRQIYDQYGKEGLSDGPGGGPFDPGFGGGMGTFFGPHGLNPFSGFFSFNFRDPNDVFREFFGNDPLGNFFDSNRAQNSQANNGAHQGMSTSMFMNPFAMFDAMGPAFQTMNTMSIHTGNSQPNGSNVKRVSTTTKKVNGKTIVTKKVVDNGVETTTVTEDGKVTSHTVNGVPQLM